jgi:predicted RND superfamily exporter protein
VRPSPKLVLDSTRAVAYDSFGNFVLQGLMDAYATMLTSTPSVVSGYPRRYHRVSVRTQQLKRNRAPPCGCSRWLLLHGCRLASPSPHFVSVLSVTVKVCISFGETGKQRAQ